MADDQFGTALDDRRWTMGTGTMSKSFEIESWSYVQHKDYVLQLLQKKEFVSPRPTLPLSTVQRIALFCTYVTLTSKRETVTTSEIDFSEYIASVSLTMIFTILPYYFMVLFLATYSSHDHLYVSKMVPSFWGCNLQIIMGSLFFLLSAMDSADTNIDMVFDGLWNQLPWTRCPENTNNKSTINCYPYDEFKTIVKNPTTKILNQVFRVFRIVNNETRSENFRSSYMAYFSYQRYKTLNKSILDWKAQFSRVFIVLLCFGAGFIFYKKYFWKVFEVFFWILNGIYLFCLLYVLLKYLEGDKPNVQKRVKYIPDELIDADLASIGFATTAPPMLHIIFSRASNPIDPDWDSGLLVAACFIYVIFRATVDYYVKFDTEADIGFPYNLPNYNSFSSSFYFPLFFNLLPLGGVLTLVMFFVKFLCEFTVYVAAYQSFIEVILWEWPWRRLKRWMISVVLAVVTFILFNVVPFYCRTYLYAITQVIAMLTEVIVITAFYPLGRLIDDITFQHGTPPAKLRFYTFLILPIYLSYKSYKSLYSLLVLPSVGESKGYTTTNSRGFKIIRDHLWSFVHAYWIISIVPLFIGFIYAAVKYIAIKKKKWSSLLRPKPTWGPRDHVTRQLRKQYDSRDYIPSQSSRYLARHMLAKAEAATYRLDVRYDTAVADRRRSLGGEALMKMEQEKKSR